MKLAKISEQMKGILRNRMMLTAQVTEDKVTVHKARKICLVCKGEIRGHIYVCDCDALYCENCTRALTDLENVCWACNAPMDKSKPVKHYEEEEEGTDLKISRKDKKEVKK